MTMTLIATSTVGAGGAASIDFTAIAGTATDLYLVLSWNSSVNNDSIFIQFNGSASSYTKRNLFGFGTGSPISQSGSDSYFNSNKTTTANTFNSGQVYIPNYAGATNKSFSSEDVSEANGADSYANLTAGLWSSTAAITSIKLDLASGNFIVGSTASLYSVTKGSGGASVSP